MRLPVWAGLTLFVLGVTLAHEMTPVTHPWHWTHIFLEKLYYPALLVAAASGWRLALGATALVSLLYSWAMLGAAEPMVSTEMSSEIVSYWLVTGIGLTLFGRLKRASLALREAHSGALHALAAAVDLREKETGNHCRRVQAYSRLLAERAGFDRDQMPELLSGALLHDIGKIGIPDAILLKPGPLSATEREVIEMHPTMGLELVGQIPFLSEARLVVGSHHERWDGRGYPSGLSAEAIPRVARLFSIVDVFDALTSPRTYRSPLSASKALEYLQEQAGHQFDPRLVAVFCAIPPEELARLAAEHGLDLQCA